MITQEQDAPHATDLWRAARARWPGIYVPAAEFAAWLNGRPRARYMEDLYLALACVRADNRALAVFNRIIVEQVSIGGRSLTPAELDELHQELRTRLLVGEGNTPPRLAGYNGEGSLRAWVRTAAARVAVDLWRSRKMVAPDDMLFDLADSGPNPELNHLRHRYGGEIKEALRAAFGSLTTEDQLVLRQHYLDGVTLPKLAHLHGVHRVTILRRIARARLRLTEAARREIQRQSRLDEAELDSVLRLVDSQIEISFPTR